MKLFGILISFVAVFILINVLSISPSFAQKPPEQTAKRIIRMFLKESRQEIKPGTIEYQRFLKWVALGEYPELTGTDSKFVHTQEERDAVFQYATRNMDKGIRANFLKGEPNAQQATALSSSKSDFSRERLEAIRYAYEWSEPGGIRHNPDFADFGHDDCTNFISQAMNAGGFFQIGSGDGCKWEDTVQEWYMLYNPSPPIWCIGDFNDWEWSTSWSVTWPFRNYFAYEHEYAIDKGWTMSASLAKTLLRPGDVVQLQTTDDDGYWYTYHTMIITDEDSNEVYVTYHSGQHGLDVVDRPLSDIPTGYNIPQRYLLVEILYSPYLYLPTLLHTSDSAVDRGTFVSPLPTPQY